MHGNVARHLDAARDRRDPAAQARRAGARGPIRRLDAIAGTGASMPRVP